jgi:hypothetical protein
VQRTGRAPLVPRAVRVDLQRLLDRVMERREPPRRFASPVSRLLQHRRLEPLANRVARQARQPRTISRTDLFSRKYIRLTLPIMAMVITPSPLLKKEAG